MLQKFRHHIEQNFPKLQDRPFLLACSGGVDSMVLAHLCAQANLDFALAHCNFKLRGTASDEDEKFVSDLAKELNKKVFITRFDTIDYANQNKVSVQMAARDLRYAWFAEIMKEYGYAYLITAHQADDDLETFLINLSRGTGIDGLSGIPEQNDHILRPLLQFSRAQILAFAQEKRISWREDASNEDTKYLRNKIRHEIIPFLKELHPTFTDNFNKTREFLAGSASILKHHIKDLKKQLFIPDDNHFRISVEALERLNPLKPYLHAIFKAYGFTEWDNVHQLLTAISGKEVRSKTHRLIKDRGHLLLQEIASEIQPDYSFSLEKLNIRLPIKLLISEVDHISDTSKEILYVDKETLNHRLEVRKWKKGDYFYPMGMKGKKKLSKFFKDEKLSKIAKEEQWLLCSGEQIVWVIGKRADDRFKVTEKTKNILKFSLEV